MKPTIQTDLINKTNEIIIPKGWKIKKIIGNKIIIKETEKELPTSWEQCFETLDEGEYIHNLSQIKNITYRDGIINLLQNRNTLPIGCGIPMLYLCMLLVCREVYRQGWKPDWKDDTDKYCIEYYNGDIVNNIKQHSSKILSFQSEKIRDKFFKNFHHLIEKAKELI